MSNRFVSAPLVSVIIPTYNTARYLLETLECALNQSWANKEIIVVDDGSTDHTSSLLQPYMEKIIYIYQENRGLGAARNTGLKAAKGEFIAFLDADDLVSLDFIEVMVDELNKKPGVDILYCWWSFIDEAGKDLPEQGRYTGKGNLFYDFVLSNRIPVHTALTPRRCIDAVSNFDENLLIFEDWDFWLRIAQKGFQFDYIPKVLAKYRFHGSNMTLDVDRSSRRYTAVLDKLFQSKQLPEGILALKPIAYSQILLTKSLLYTSQGYYPNALEALKEAVRSWPELIIQKETFYRLASAEQPSGYRDTTMFRDLHKMEQQIDEWLEGLLTDSELAAQLTGYEKRARIEKNIALAELYYQSNNGVKTRQLLSQAIQISPTEAMNQQVINLWLRSILGRNLIQKIKRRMPRARKLSGVQ